LHTIKKYYINKINYKIKENFYGTEVPKDKIIKGQTGAKTAFSSCWRSNAEPKIIKDYNIKLNNEEIKNEFFPLKRNERKCYSRNTMNNTLNSSYKKRKEHLTFDNNRNNNSKAKTKISNKKQEKNNLLNKFILQLEKEKAITPDLNNNNSNENNSGSNNELDAEAERAKKIMERTIIKVGKDYLSLKEIGKRVKNFSMCNSSELSIVKNVSYNKTYSNNNKQIFSEKHNKTHNLNINKTGNQINSNKLNGPVSFNIKLMSMTTTKNRNIFSKNNKLPRIPINTYNNFTNLMIKNKMHVFNRFNLKNKTKLKFFKYGNIYKNYGTCCDINENNNNFEVILTNDSNPILNPKKFINKLNKKV